MKKLFLSLCAFLFVGCNSEVEELPIVPIKKSAKPIINQFQAVWDEVKSDKVLTLPQERVSYSKLFHGSVDLISRNARRTLSSDENILEYFDKLAHPNGVCLKGVWKIEKENPYGGYFKYMSEALIIARASSAMSNTKRGENRAFGMAGKLFPTMNPLEINDAKSANFFVIDDLGGSDAEYYTDVSLTNEPDVSFTTTILGSLAYGLKVASAFSDADKNSGIRQLYEISHLKESNTSAVLTPKWMKIEAKEHQTKYGVNDFRDEFMLKDKETLFFNIFVASREKDGVKDWQKIGRITFNASIVSITCDHRLHFHHPLWRDDLRYE